MRTKPYPEHFDAFRRAALEAEITGRTVRAYTRAAASVSSTGERLQRLVASVIGAGERSAPSPYESYRSKRRTTPQGRVLPTQGPGRGASAAHDLSVFNDLNSAVPVPVSKTRTIVTRDQLAQMLNISPRWAGELGRTGIFPRVGKNQYDATDLITIWIDYKFLK